MRADDNRSVGNSVESCRDESDHLSEDLELKIPENGENKKSMCELFYDTRSGDEWDKENGVNASEEVGKKLRDDASHHDSIEKVDPVFYMDKNVTACDLPEVVVCYKEKTYQVVKDICVDEGLPVQEKFLFGEKDSLKCSSNSNQCGSEDSVNVNPLETKSLEDRNSKVVDSEICNDPNQDVEESSIKDVTNAEVKDSVSGLNPLETSFESGTDENLKDEVAAVENVLMESLTLGDILLREDEQMLLSNKNGDKPEEQSLPQLQEKEKRSLETTALETELEETEEPNKADQKISSVSTTTSQDSSKTCNNPEKLEPENPDSCEDNKLFTSGFGETSFSAAEPVSVSGHITYSGPIAFSGSLSVRSDASTTSGKSFAFPILQSEWNSSPVRMAKADRRRPKGWRQSLLCCRF